MPAARAFIDSNVVLYSLGDDVARKLCATTLIACNAVVSTQVLVETANVARRKFGFTVPQVRAVLASLRASSEVQMITEATIERALDIAERYGYSTYDSLIIAAALEAGCNIVYSEDLQHGQHIDGRLAIVNPFRTA